MLACKAGHFASSLSALRHRALKRQNCPKMARMPLDSPLFSFLTPCELDLIISSTPKNFGTSLYVDAQVMSSQVTILADGAHLAGSRTSQSVSDTCHWSRTPYTHNIDFGENWFCNCTHINYTPPTARVLFRVVRVYHWCLFLWGCWGPNKERQ